MGVPRFFRTTSERYPQINVDLDSAVAPGVDNLYIDMNGVVHNCARGSSAPGEPDSARYHTTANAPRAFADTFLAVFKYLDNLFALVAPRRVVYLAIDGVAPRAKMNQQRSRRFRSAKEREEEHARALREDPMYKASGVEPFDSNCITPGTQFMAELTEALAYFVHKRVTEDAAWRSCEVILSGAEVPGEGEHKIMEYIRAMKLAGRIPPNTRHCVYGLDADLIMLGLVTHEPHFMLLREKVDFTAFFKRKSTMRFKSVLDTVEFGAFQLLSVSLLREYLALDVGGSGLSELPFFNIERIVDDFVFIAMLVGNDFLPHLPTIEMADGALGTLLLLYKRLLPRFGGYISDKGAIVPDRFELFALMMGLLEAQLLPKALVGDNRSGGGDGRRGGGRGGGRGRNTAAAAKSEFDLDGIWGFEQHTPVVAAPWTEEELQNELARVRHELTKNQRHITAKRNYYLKKVGFDCDTEEGAAGLRKLVGAYVEGVVWTLKYYFEGCADWRWYYPHHYAPLASDILHVAELMSEVKLERGTPFKPMEQLLSVLPPSSAWCLPKPFRLLMTHPSSPIRDKYPVNFDCDKNGKRNDWEAVVLLPFIDEKMLMDAMGSVPVTDLTPAERKRNTNGVGVVYGRRDPEDESVTTVVSPFPGRLPNVVSLARTRPLELPHVAYGVPFSSEWVAGTYATGTHPLVADLPTFRPILHSARLSPVGVNVFGQQAKHDSLCVSVGVHSLNGGDELTLVEGLSSDNEAGDDVLGGIGADDGDGGNGGNGESAKDPPHWSSVQAAVEAGFGIGSVVWVGYPWRLVAVIHGISDSKRTIERIEVEGGGFSVAERPTKAKFFAQETGTAASALMDHRAIDLERPKVLFRVCVAVSKDLVTGVPKRFASDPTLFPASSVLAMGHEDVSGLAAAISESRRLGDKAPPPLRAGDSVMYGRHDRKLTGCMARVTKVFSDGYSISFPLREEFAKEAAFGMRVVQKSRASERWMPNGRVAAIVKLPPIVLGSITGSVRIKVPDSNREEIDIGLGIKYSSRGLFIPGYAKVDDRGSFVLSEKAVSLIQDYRAKFPDMFANLVRIFSREESRNGGARVLNASEVFGRSANAKEMLSAAASWVATSDLALLPLVSEDSSVLSKDAVSELEREAEIALRLRADALSQNPAGKENVTMRVPRTHLLNGLETSAQHLEMTSIAGGAAPSISPEVKDVKLGDRVVNRMATGPVPFGLRGTVVGIHPAKSSAEVAAESKKRKDDEDGGALIDVTKLARSALVEVVFDEGFIGGGDLNGRCSVTRGKAVPPGSLLLLLPAKDVVYYTRNYARVSSEIATRPSPDARAAQAEINARNAKKAKMANAAVRSYAEAARGNPVVASGGGGRAATAAVERGSNGQKGGKVKGRGGSSSRASVVAGVNLESRGEVDGNRKTAGLDYRPPGASLPLPKFAPGRKAAPVATLVDASASARSMPSVPPSLSGVAGSVSGDVVAAENDLRRLLNIGSGHAPAQGGDNVPSAPGVGGTGVGGQHQAESAARGGRGGGGRGTGRGRGNVKGGRGGGRGRRGGMVGVESVESSGRGKFPVPSPSATALFSQLQGSGTGSDGVAMSNIEGGAAGAASSGAGGVGENGKKRNRKRGQRDGGGRGGSRNGEQTSAAVAVAENARVADSDEMSELWKTLVAKK